MIFQINLQLKVENRDVHLVIDLDTGLIGFTEILNEETIEYTYQESPKEFKIALVEQLELIGDNNKVSNFKISRKSKLANLLHEISANQS